MESRTRVVIIQPGTVYGPRGTTFTELPCRLASEGAFCWIESGSGNVNYVYVDNLVDAALLAAQLGSSGSRFIVTDGLSSWREFLRPLLAPWDAAIPDYSSEEFAALHERRARSSWKDVVRAAVSSPALMQAISQHRVLGPLKTWFTRWMPTKHRDIQALRGKPSLIMPATPPAVTPPAWLADLFGPNSTQYSSALAREVLGWTPNVGMAEGQARSADWLRDVRCR
ncbi:MAG: hypothetical protein L0099_09085 [Acidobacteria bacterium]|nr:hypothetical protein [Acidobacteriota bacterium]